MNEWQTRYRMVRFSELSGVECPCGIAHRAFHDFPEFPGTVHVTDISIDAKLHYHRKLTETYYFLECEPGARMHSTTKSSTSLRASAL
jgi:hypothetical protein